LRPDPLVSVFVAVFAAALVFATPAAAQDLDPCVGFTDCTETDDGWIASGDGTSLYPIDCPPGTFAVGSDVVLPRGRLVFAATVAGPPSGRFIFGLVPPTANISWKPAAGCLQRGAMVSPSAATAPPYRVRVRTRRIRPGVERRVRLGCRPGERLAHSGSGVAFHTPDPPLAAIVRALEQRHRRSGSVTRTHVVGPPGVGDDERVELQVTVLCSRPRRRESRPAQSPSDLLCGYFSGCTTQTGPWVTASVLDNVYQLGCPDADPLEYAVDSSFVFSPTSPVIRYPVGTFVAGGVELGFTFGAMTGFPGANPPNEIYQPMIGCAPSGACFLCPAGGFLRPAEFSRPYRTRVRTRRIRPGANVRLRLGCGRDRRLVYSGSAIAFFTRRPPAPALVRALKHGHRRGESVARASVSAPAGVGDNERVELQATAFCARVR
jgi:hypothetical protein